jgi:uncharacterized MAPEG superfamily protein
LLQASASAILAQEKKMSVADWCFFGAIMLALLTLAPVKPLAGREFDNANPRDPRFYEKPVRRRALGAHINGLETFPFFAVSILLSEFRHAPQTWIDVDRAKSDRGGISASRYSRSPR